MKRFFKRLFLLLVLLITSVSLIACDKPTPDPDPNPDPPVVEVTKFTVTFDSNGGSAVDSVQVEKDRKVTKPADPTREGFEFQYWYVVEGTEYDFATPVVADLVLTAHWTEVEVVVEKTAEEKIQEDLDAIEASLIVSDYELNLVKRGPVNNSTISWSTTSPYIALSGVLLPVAYEDGVTTTGEVTATLRLDGKKVEHTFQVPLVTEINTVIAETRTLPFTNMTNEYDVADGSLELYFEENGNVPYVSLGAFFELVRGFIDPEVVFTHTTTGNILEISYEYFSESQNHLFNLVVTIDAENNTISTNDPGFYWAYVYSTETNYGRHIEYIDHPDESQLDGVEVVYEMNLYNIDIPVYEGKVLLPFYLANQLFVGSSYYNVYYNGEGLYGIYALPESDEEAYKTMKTGALNNAAMPVDLRIHNYNMLAFNLNYFYGLKDIMNVESYYPLLEENRNDLLNSSARIVDTAIFNILLKELDEPHTSFGYPSYFNNPLWPGPSASSLTAYGPRFTQWYYDAYVYVDSAIENKWGNTNPNSWAAYSDSRPDYWLLNEEYAVVTLDKFATKDIEETTTHSDTLVRKILKLPETSVVLPEIVGGNKYFFYNTGTKEEDKLEIIVKGLDATYLATYAQALETFGYTKVVAETTEESKVNGYYTHTIDNITFMVQIAYDELYQVLYVGAMKEVSETYEAEWPFTVSVDSLIDGDSAVYLEFTLEMLLAEHPLVKNITLDLTWNSGGNVGALYRVIGFITDQPFRVTNMDGGDKSAASGYVQIVGVPYNASLNWSLLVSPHTFSAGNSLTKISKENNLGPVMGIATGGGACSITPILLPSGTAFTMSSNSISAYRTGAGTEKDPYVYHDVEFGLEPDFIIDNYDDLYNVEILLGFLTTP